jgi:peptide/nickel transport system ATP-binding protein
VIARALSLNPDILICDESVSALDVSVQAQVLNLLNTLKERFSFTFLFISHDLSVIKYMTDRVIILNKGVIEELDETDKVFNNPIRDYTKQLLKANGY